MKFLQELLKYDDIVVQCHDNPDADALASGYALKWYLEKNGKKARFVYGGANEITKSNLVLMKNELNIDVEHVTELPAPEMLVTVDCQYGESNVTKFDAKNIAVVDHHQVSRLLPDLNVIRSNYGSCASIMYELLKKEKININKDVKLATALYYGLMTDTNNFEEISHPVDRDLRDSAKPKLADVVLFKNSNLSRLELTIAGDALKHAHYNEEKKYAVVYAKPCDPNILGIISDMLLGVDSIETCLVYSVMPFGVKLSVRSCVKEVKASELADYLCEGFGGGGGHVVKAGGFMQKDLILNAGLKYDEESMNEFLGNRMESYFDTNEVIYAGVYEDDGEGMEYYIKKSLHLGYVKASDFASSGSRILIRTLEGDVEVTVYDDVYMIVGFNGDVYPISKEKFEATYSPSSEDYSFTGEYAPAVIDIGTGNRIELLPFIKSCISKGGDGIYARELDHRVKVFTVWDEDKYYLGKEGDFLAVRPDDHSDVYVIARDVFERSYYLS